MTVAIRASAPLRRFLISVAIATGAGAVLAWSTISSTAAPQPPAPAARANGISARQQALCLDGGQASAIRHLRTGAVRFVGTEPGRPITHRAVPSGSSPETAARAYLEECGDLFGVARQADQLKTKRSETISNEHRSVVRFQQTHNGVPVIGGELLVHVDDAHNVLAVAGKTLPETTIGIVPSIAAATAARNAIATVGKAHGLDASELTASNPELSIYNPMLVGPESGPTRLVWRIDVTPRELLPIRELVLVDAERGSVSLHFNQVDTALNRQTYTSGNTTTLPGTLVCTEADPTCAAGDSHAAAAHLYGADTYNFYQTNHGRNSIDNLGLTIRQSVHYSTNYVNAFWNGSQMVYGQGFASGRCASLRCKIRSK